MYDVAIVGAGTAGAAAAALCAERGLSTVCVDRRPLAEAGARWVNGVPAWAFTEAGFEPPSGDERLAADHVFHLVVGWGPQRLTLRGHGLLDVDMRALVERLQDRARRAGAVLRGDATITAFDGRRLQLGPHADDADDVIEARWFVDASGLTGARLLRQAPVPRHDLCAAAQQVHALADPRGAREWLDQHDAAEGDTLCFTSVAGGYSIVSVRVEPDAVSLLTGSIPAAGHPSGQRLLDDFAAAHPWIGARRFGGARAVPLGRSRDVLAEGNVALVGDAAGQVFSAHGSGIAAGLLAARLLADTLADGRGPEPYGVQWQRRYGGLFAAYDAFRRFSQGLGLHEVEQLLDAGLLDEDSAIAALQQQLPRMPLAKVVTKAGTLLRSRRLATRFAPVAARMIAAQALYRSYPAEVTQRARWCTWAARLLE